MGTAFSWEHSLPTASRSQGHLEPGLVLSKSVTLKGLNASSLCGPSGQGGYIFSNKQVFLSASVMAGWAHLPVNSRDRSPQPVGGLPPCLRPPPRTPAQGCPAAPTRLFLLPPSSAPWSPRSPEAPPRSQAARGIRQASNPPGEPGTRSCKAAACPGQLTLLSAALTGRASPGLGHVAEKQRPPPPRVGGPPWDSPTLTQLLSADQPAPDKVKDPGRSPGMEAG